GPGRDRRLRGFPGIGSGAARKFSGRSGGYQIERNDSIRLTKVSIQRALTRASLSGPMMGGGSRMEAARRHSILVIDDEPDVVESVRDLLRLDYRVLCATRAREG